MRSYVDQMYKKIVDISKSTNLRFLIYIYIFTHIPYIHPLYKRCYNSCCSNFKIIIYYYKHECNYTPCERLLITNLRYNVLNNKIIRKMKLHRKYFVMH